MNIFTSQQTSAHYARNFLSRFVTLSDYQILKEKIINTRSPLLGKSVDAYVP